MDTYMTRNIEVQAVQWDGSNLDEIISLIGQANVNPIGDLVQVRNHEGEWVTVRPDWWVSRDENGEETVHSADAFRKFFES